MPPKHLIAVVWPKSKEYSLIDPSELSEEQLAELLGLVQNVTMEGIVRGAQVSVAIPKRAYFTILAYMDQMRCSSNEIVHALYERAHERGEVTPSKETVRRYIANVIEKAVVN